MLIYKFTNKSNGKVYVGLTERHWQHREYTYNAEIKNIKNTRPIIKALREVGWEGFDVEFIDESATTVEELYELETSYIQQFDSTHPDKGYNKIAKLRALSDERRESIKQGAKQRWANTSEEEKSDRVSKLHAGRKAYFEKATTHGDWLARRFIVENKEGEKVEVENLAKFCKDRKISTANLYATEDQSCCPYWAKGWRLIEKLGKQD